MFLARLVAIFGLAVLMIVHESGHFFAARAFGMRVTRFSIGFGPTLAKVMPENGYFWLTLIADRFKIRLFKHDPARHGETIYQLAMIPMLAYVQIAGMNPMEDVDPNDKSSYANASLLGRICTIFAGPLANYLFASVFFFISIFFGGLPDKNTTQVVVVDGDPAMVAGMHTGDRIVSVGGTDVKDWHQMADVISTHPGKPLPVLVERGAEQVALTVTPKNNEGKGLIGVQQNPTKHPVGIGIAAKLAITEPVPVVVDLVVGIVQTITLKVKPQFYGPIGIVNEAAKAANRGWTDLLNLLGIISAYLGAFNLIPFPALDGGRLMFLGYEATTRKRPNARIEAHIHAIGLVMMISLSLYITFAHDLGLGSK